MKKLLALFLVLVLIFSLAACSATVSKSGDKGSSPTASADSGKSDGDGGKSDGGNATTAPTSAPISIPGAGAPAGSYAKAYEQFSELLSAAEIVNEMVDANNAKIEKAKPSDYWNDPNYTMLFWLPFLSIDMAFTASFDENTSDENMKMALEFLLDNPVYTHVAKNSYKVEYDVNDWDTGELDYRSAMTADYDERTGALRYIKTTDEGGEWRTEYFVEFVPLGNDTYALLSTTERALMTCKDGVMTELYYAANRSFTDYGAEEGEEPFTDVVTNDYGIYPDGGGCDQAWVLQNEDNYSMTVVYTGGVLTMTNREYEASYDSNQKCNGVTWTWKEPIVIE